MASPNECGLRVASFNLKAGLHTVTTKLGLRPIATLHEFGRYESVRVAFTSFSGAASYAYDCGLKVASLESGPVAFLFEDCGL